MSVTTPMTKQLQKELKIKNLHAVPRITKVVVNVGVGKHRDDKGYVEAVMKDLAAITGQKPRERRARKAVAGFKVREGNLVGYQVTLRGKRMEDFIQRFVNITLPRVRDFRGLPSTSFDGSGNVSVGMKEHMAFPEIQADKTDVMFGVEVTFVTSAKDNDEARKLFAALGFPFTTKASEVAGLPTMATSGIKKD
ncbi:MAG: 50S ribosomal protein L5 [Candidatus Andersenbacteria bacterium]|nr:50S ribosomal protein L5 [Candidatus Andersenbacteria bacterium]MBI3251052.1 50S ribosomal protein L5 [Candidatus Andersenbacteria bacterium]